MNQFQVLLRVQKKSILAWSIGVGAYILLMGLVYIGMGGAEGLGDLAESYPQDLLEAFGAEDLTSVTGWLDAEFGSFAPLVFGIFLIMVMTKQLAGAEEAGQLDHSLARPITRGAYYWSVLAMGSVEYAIILGSATVAGIIGFAGIAEGNDLANLVGFMVDFLPYGVIFIGIGGLLGAIFHQRTKANAVGAAIVAGMFVMEFTGRLVDELEFIKYLTPMGYLARSDLAHGDPDIAYWFISFIVGGICAVAGWKIFERKQLYA